MNIPLCAKNALSCDGCTLALARSHETGDVVECVCGRRYEPRQRLSGIVDVRVVASTPSAPPERPRHPPPRLVYVAPDGDAPTAPPTALERAGAAAMALRPDDPELARVRRLLTDLRAAEERAEKAEAELRAMRPAAELHWIRTGLGVTSTCARCGEARTAWCVGCGYCKPACCVCDAPFVAEAPHG